MSTAMTFHRSLCNILVGSTIFGVLAVVPALAQQAPASPVLRINPSSSVTAAPVEMQDGSGHWKPIGTLNPTTGSFLPQGQDAVAAAAVAAQAKADAAGNGTTPFIATGETTALAAATRFGLLLPSVTGLGAKCDGTTNDTPAFQKAVTLGYEVRAPAGRCVITGSLLPTNGSSLKGMGQPQQFQYGQNFVPGTILDFRGAPAGVDGIAPSSTVQNFRLSDLQISGAPGHCVNGSFVFSHFERVTLAYCGGDGLHLSNSYLTKVDKSLFEFNGKNGLTDTTTGQYTTLDVSNSEATHNGGDGYLVDSVNSTSFHSTGSDNNGGCGYRIAGTNALSNIGLFSPDSERNGLSNYCAQTNTNVLMAAASGAVGNTSNTAGETNFLKATGTAKVRVLNSYDIAPANGVPSIAATGGAQVIVDQSPMASSVTADAASFAGTLMAPGAAPGAVNVGGYAASATARAIGLGEGVVEATFKLTTSATTPARLTPDGTASTAASSCIPVPVGSVMTLRGSVLARDGNTGDRVAYDITGAAVYRQGGNAVVDNPGPFNRTSVTGVFGSQVPPALAVDTVNQCIYVSVTPINVDSISWKATLSVMTGP